MRLLDGFHWTHESWGPALRSAPLSALADHFFTTRQLWLRGESERADWAAAAAAIGVAPDRLLRLRQVHGRRAAIARSDRLHLERLVPAGAHDGLATVAAVAGGTRPEADILVSDDPAVALAIQVADCVPLLMAHRHSPAVAAVHAGWRGTAAGAAGAALEVLWHEFGAAPQDVVVAQGPSIGACCYEVGDELVAAFESAGFGAQVERWFSRDSHGAVRLDLWTANRDQLVAAGLPAGNIHQARLCTASLSEWFPSYRRDGPGTGRIAAVIRSRG